MKKLFYVCLTLAVAVPVQLTAQRTQPLTLDRIFASREFAPQRFGPARWLEGGSYTTVEPSQAVDGAVEIVRYDASSGRREVMISAAQLTPPTQATPLLIEDYTWSADGDRLLIFTNSRRVWRRNTRGDYWVLDVGIGRLRQLGGDAPESTLMFAKFSPDGDRVGYVRQNNVYVEDLTSGRITQLTRDGSTTIINGTFDWVYEEEFSLRDGFRWSPDGTRIAYWQLDASGVRDFYLINDTDSLYSFVIPIQYPKAGTTNSAGRVGVVSAGGGPTTWFAIEGDPRNNYIARMEWAANSEEIIVQYLNRAQNTNRVLLGTAETGAVRTVFTDRDDAWLDVVDDLRWLDDGGRFTWVSERDGWRRVYMVSRDGETITAITPPETDVMSVEQISEADGWLYYMASPDNATQRYLYRVRLTGGGSPERISPADPGTHGYQISPDGRWAFHTYSTFDTPPVISLVSLPDHRVVRTVVDNAPLRERLATLNIPETEFFRVDVGEGVELDAWMMRPHNFDPSRKYPIVFYVYGEPAGQTVLDRWGGSRLLWHFLLTEQGYIVASMDNRGTPAPRGRDWRKIVYGEIGTISSQDQANGAQRIIADRPYVDGDRVGVWGWSGGGSSTLSAMFRYPDVYHTGMSVAPVPDQRYYDTIYQERYMGLPQENVEGYRNGSPITYANQLRGNLLIVHGTGDDNVHYQGTEALINRLIEHNKHFTMMAYPNRSHGIFEGRGTTRHLYGLLTRYLKENLPAGPR
ncbi:MAG: S9 family peptidase [Gemmatimonadetes bacterium]|nr:S9 family peptidase [Gemmatimonadota bacterium]